jgi:thermitase
LNGKTDKGFDAHSFGGWFSAIAGFIDPFAGVISSEIAGAVGSGARTDNTGHGTMVATTCGAWDNNARNGAGVAPRSGIYPVKITDDSTAMGDDLSIMSGLLHVMSEHSAKIVNISYGGMTDPSRDPALHMYFRMFHDVYGGIIFVSAGNDSAHMNNGVMSYLNVVSAIDPSLNKADFSNWGNCVTFTAPGVGIMLTDRTGASVTANGTSFASPICAGIAALVWSANPGLSNSQVESIMKTTALRTSGGGWTPFFGFGMPDAFAAVRAARG